MTISEMIALRLGGVPVLRVRRCLQLLSEAGLTVKSQDIAAHHLAGGRIEALTDALISAKSLNVPINLHRISAIDLALGSSNEDFPLPVDVVVASTKARIVRLPGKGAFEFTGPAKFTWRPWCEASVVIELDRFIGGAPLGKIEEALHTTLGAIYDQAGEANTARAAAAKVDFGSLGRGTRFRLTGLKVSD